MENEYYIYKIQYICLINILNDLSCDIERKNMTRNEIRTKIMKIIRDSFNLTCNLLKEEEIND